MNYEEAVREADVLRGGFDSEVRGVMYRAQESGRDVFELNTIVTMAFAESLARYVASFRVAVGDTRDEFSRYLDGLQVHMKDIMMKSYDYAKQQFGEQRESAPDGPYNLGD